MDIVEEMQAVAEQIGHKQIAQACLAGTLIMRYEYEYNENLSRDVVTQKLVSTLCIWSKLLL